MNEKKYVFPKSKIVYFYQGVFFAITFGLSFFFRSRGHETEGIVFSILAFIGMCLILKRRVISIEAHQRSIGIKTAILGVIITDKKLRLPQNFKVRLKKTDSAHQQGGTKTTWTNLELRSEKGGGLSESNFLEDVAGHTPIQLNVLKEIKVDLLSMAS